MGKAKKSTKKFITKNLKGVMEQRQMRKKMKARYEKKGSATAAAPESDAPASSSSSAAPQSFGQKGRKNNKTADIADMDMEEFFSANVASNSDAEDSAGDSSDEEIEEDRLSDMDDDGQDVTIDDDGEDDADEDADEIERHKRELEELRERDPEFFKYLSQHDKRLLDFGEEAMSEESASQAEGDAEENDDAMSDEHSDGESEDGKRMKKGATRKPLSLKQVNAWESALNEKVSTHVLKKLLLAFRSACHVSDVEKSVAMKHTFRIETGALYNKILVATMRTVPQALYTLSGGRVEDLSNGTAPLAKALKGWKRTEIFAKSFLGNLLHLLPSLSSPSMLLFSLRHIIPAIPFVASFKMYSRKLLKMLLSWLSHVDEHVALRSFIALRALSLSAPSPFLAVAMKGVYMTAVRASRQVSYISLPRITFLTQCVVDLFGTDLAAGYQLAFIYIRQCAIHLRNAMASPSKESTASIYNWQFIQSLRILSSLLSTHVTTEDHPYRPLVFPLVQVISGAIRLVPTPRYYPLRFACVRMLNTISKATGFYIPVLSHLLEVHAHFVSPASVKKGPDSKLTDLTCILKVSKSLVKTRGYGEACLAECVELLCEHFAMLARSIAFPEMTVLATNTLKKQLKDARNVKMKKAVSTLLDRLAETATIVVKRRDEANLAPKDVEKALIFGSFVGDRGELPIERYWRIEKERRDRERKEIAQAAQGDMFEDDQAGSGSDVEDDGVEVEAVGDEDEEVERPAKKARKEESGKDKKNADSKKAAAGKKRAADSDSDDGSDDDDEIGDFDMKEFA